MDFVKYSRGRTEIHRPRGRLHGRGAASPRRGWRKVLDSSPMANSTYRPLQRATKVLDWGLKFWNPIILDIGIQDTSRSIF